MKLKIFILVFCMILLVGSVSAIGWDNKLTYSENNLKVNLTNWWGYGEDYGSAKLTSHKSVDEVLKFGYGKEEIVLIYDFDFKNNYVDGLGKVYFTNQRTDEQIQKDYYFVYWTLRDIEVDNYVDVCDTLGNGTKYCNKELSGKKIIQEWGWEKLINKDIPKGKIRIGLKTYIKKGDYLDAVWTIAGKEVKKHASWSASLTVGLMSVYNLDEISGTVVIDSINRDNGTAQNSPTQGLPSVANNLGTSYGFSPATADRVDSISVTSPDHITVSAWIYPVTDSADRTLFDFGTMLMSKANGNGIIVNTVGDSATSTTLLVNQTWNHIIIIVNNTGTKYFINGTEEAIKTSYKRSDGVIDSLIIGKFDGGQEFNGRIDQVMIWNRSLSNQEASDLLNDGIGINFTTQFSPTINLVSPIDNFNTTDPSITFNGTITIVTPDNVTLFIDDVGNETNSTGILDHYQFTKIISEGTHTWNYQACSSAGCNNGTERTFTVDFTKPILNITFPTTEIEFHVKNNNLSVNWTVSDLLLDTCILQFEEVNKTVTCLDNQTQINITGILNNTIIFYANDSLGNSNSFSRSWDYKIFQNSITFTNETTEGNLETFSLNVTKLSSLQISKGDLIYNGVTQSGTFTSSGDVIIFTKDLVIPAVITKTNFTFNWSISLSDSTVINTTNLNQTINNILIDDCSVFGTDVYNYTLVDEENQTQLNNVEIDINIDLLSSDRSVEVLNFSKAYTNNPARVCMNINLTTNQYKIDSVVRYTNPDHEIEYYNILNFSLTNESIYQNITLFDLLSLDSTEFQLTFKGEDFLEVENALIFINRQYITENNSFKTVELPKTDSDGQTVVHLVEKDVVYNIIVTNGTNGKILGSFFNLIAFCEDATIGDCKINLNALTTSEEIFIYNNEIKVSISEPTFNTTTRVISLDFVTFDGSTRLVRLESNKTDILGDSLVCDNSLTSASGTLSCTVPASLGNSTVSIFVYVDGVLINQNFITLDAEDFGDEGYFILFLFMLLLIMMFSESKSIMLVVMAIGLMSGIGLSLIKGEVIGGFSSVILLIVVILIALWKLNKDKPS